MALISYPTKDTLFLLDAGIAINTMEQLPPKTFVRKIAEVFPKSVVLLGPRPEDNVTRLGKLSENIRSYIICTLLCMQRLHQQIEHPNSILSTKSHRKRQLAESREAFYVLLRVYIKLYEQRDLRASIFSGLCDMSPRDLNFLEIELLCLLHFSLIINTDVFLTVVSDVCRGKTIKI
ncbi:Hypothetical protein GLP15_751 [Giardia lamblia P15]|uniref:Uncharacterized protein n=1 Tax=Giardia intestinalis (strain P15) TaxID=658858 RepID=E1F5H0_GIAIA|nr:Hypothetical protein GLP15_751 [Giardia lamblia P15]